MGSRTSFRKFLVCAVLFNFLCISWGKAAAGGHEQVKRVLLVHAFDEFLPYSVTVSKTIRSALVSEKKIKIDIYSEYLDFARFPDPQHRIEVFHHLRNKYSKKPIDLILVMLFPGYEFIYTAGETLFPGASVVFFTIQDQQLKLYPPKPNMTGVVSRIYPKKTLESILRLHPRLKKVVVIGGMHPNDRIVEDTIREEFKEYESRISVEYFTGTSMDAVIEKVTRLPDDSVILYTTIFLDGEKKAFVPAEVAAMISKISPVPVYSLFSTYIGLGIVGGCLLDFSEEAKKAVELALRILNGGKPSGIPVVPSPSSFQFDWLRLKRWNLDESLLPVGSIIINKKPSLWPEYRKEIIGIFSFIIIQSVFIALLVLQRMRKREVESNLRASEMRLNRANEELTAANEEFEAQNTELIDTHKKLTLSDNIVNNIQTGMCIFRREGERFITIFANSAASRIPEILSSSLPNPDIQKTAASQVFPDLSPHLNEVLSTGEPRSFEALRHGRDGALENAYWVKVFRLPDNSVGASFEEITERKNLEEMIRSSLKEKEVLLREVHHRVKNNMNVILSLINLQTDASREPRIKMEFKTIENRIRAMSSVHENLYNSGNMAHVDFREYLDSLCKDIFFSYTRDTERIKYTVDVGDVTMDIERAIPCGLIINELFTNSIKYAFPDGREGRIVVKASKREDFIDLVVRDNGIGLPVDFHERKRSLGFEIVKSLVVQLNGSIDISGEKGFDAKITFRIKEGRYPEDWNKKPK